jgi:hypothetical protein
MTLELCAMSMKVPLIDLYYKECEELIELFKEEDEEEEEEEDIEFKC